MRVRVISRGGQGDQRTKGNVNGLHGSRRGILRSQRLLTDSVVRAASDARVRVRGTAPASNSPVPGRQSSVQRTKAYSSVSSFLLSSTAHPHLSSIYVMSVRASEVCRVVYARRPVGSLCSRYALTSCLDSAAACVFDCSNSQQHLETMVAETVGVVQREVWVKRSDAALESEMPVWSVSSVRAAQSGLRRE